MSVAKSSIMRFCTDCKFFLQVNGSRTGKCRKVIDINEMTGEAQLEWASIAYRWFCEGRWFETKCQQPPQ